MTPKNCERESSSMSGVNGKTPSAESVTRFRSGLGKQFVTGAKRQQDAVNLYLRDIEKNPLLSASEEIHYGRLVKQGDESAQH